jgi:uncharacterized NAD(P)/FAD-binding protein YdhS
MVALLLLGIPMVRMAIALASLVSDMTARGTLRVLNSRSTPIRLASNGTPLPRVLTMVALLLRGLPLFRMALALASLVSDMTARGTLRVLNSRSTAIRRVRSSQMLRA